MLSDLLLLNCSKIFATKNQANYFIGHHIIAFILKKLIYKGIQSSQSNINPFSLDIKITISRTA